MLIFRHKDSIKSLHPADVARGKTLSRIIQSLSPCLAGRSGKDGGNRSLHPRQARSQPRQAQVHFYLTQFVPTTPLIVPCRMGFVIPPFNTVYHLHLHVQELPYTSWLKSLMYRIAPGTGGNDKGFSWFVEIKQAVKILKKGKDVGVFAC